MIKGLINLYNQSTSLDIELIYLLQQKEALEKDHKTGEEGLLAAKKSWKSLKDFLAKTKKETTIASTGTRINQLDLPAAPIFSPSPEAPQDPPLATVSDAETPSTGKLPEGAAEYADPTASSGVDA